MCYRTTHSFTCTCTLRQNELCTFLLHYTVVQYRGLYCGEIFAWKLNPESHLIVGIATFEWRLVDFPKSWSRATLVENKNRSVPGQYFPCPMETLSEQFLRWHHCQRWGNPPSLHLGNSLVPCSAAWSWVRGSAPGSQSAPWIGFQSEGSQTSSRPFWTPMGLRQMENFKVYLYPKYICWYVKGMQFRSPLHQHSKKKVYQVMK